ncbi:T9SS type A sorting domain-containing protein [Marivirga sp.]|uniref:T9SS type A sorting domain-containing protein n=1 Tax=Marivirga sp. TaxID=2018662 RepID=UPI0025F43625|nr:T9SS type A sorting domain-containing protein [Marivirga sp.]
MKKILLLIGICLSFLSFTKAQECTITATGGSTGNRIICDECGCDDSNGDGIGDLNGLLIETGANIDTIFFNTDLISEGDIVLRPSNTNIFFIPEGVTVIVNGDLRFEGNASPKDFIVNGELIVNGTLDFENQQIAISGGGSIEADSILGASKTACTTDPCETTISAKTCEDGGTNFCETSLPIELKSFEVSKAGQNIALNWVTAKEENFSHFEIERSIDQNNWSQIGLVQGMGESMSDVNYDFTDRNAPFGIIYYRLKAVDIDATFEYSPVVKIEIGFEGKLAVSPNPVKDASNLKIQVPSEFREDLAYVGLFDLSGVIVQEFRNFNTDGSLQINQKLKSGMYILKVNHNGLQENIRVIIQ